MYTVYRVEDPIDHVGPFNCDKSLRELSHDYNRYSDFNKYPTSSRDFEDRPTEERLGVLYPCQLFYWFGDDFDIIVKHFNIYIIKVRAFKIGLSGTQVIFDANDIISKRKLIKN